MPLLSAVLLLLLVLDPLGNIPLFVATLQRVELRKRTRVLIRELLIALGALLFFLLAGRLILDVLQVRQPALTIAGGVILLLISVQMVFPVSQSIFGDSPEGDPFIVPLAIPLVAGPSALTTVLLFTSLEPAHVTKWLVAVVCAWLIASAILLLSGKLSELLGSRGLIALERLMGMLLLTVAVQMFVLRKYSSAGQDSDLYSLDSESGPDLLPAASHHSGTKAQGPLSDFEQTGASTRVTNADLT